MVMKQLYSSRSESLNNYDYDDEEDDDAADDDYCSVRQLNQGFMETFLSVSYSSSVR